MPETTRTNQNKAVLLYVSTNDGSDTRINKEVGTLAKHFEVVFLGVGETTNAFVSELCKEIHLIRGKRNRPWTLFRQVWTFLLLLRKHQVQSIHIINEQLLVFFYPFLFGRHTVLDIFDSIFLRWNLGGERCRLLKRLVYWPADQLIVTDDSRRKLLPKFAQLKATVIENFPHRYCGPIVQRESGPLSLLFAGTLTMSRGGDFVGRLLEEDHALRVIMAGWLHDEGVRRLVEHDRVDYRGVISQEEVLRISATEADYIVCIYPPTNQNNVHASPNKIWDAVQTKTPVIINSEILASNIVDAMQCGLVLDDADSCDVASIAQLLRSNRGMFKFSDSQAADCNWEGIEHRLVAIHE